MKENFVIVCVVLLFLGFLGMVFFGAYINKNQLDLATIVKGIKDKIYGYDEDINNIKKRVEDARNIVNENGKKLDETILSQKNDIKTLKSNIQNNYDLIKKEKKELSDNYKKLSTILKNTQNNVYRLDNSVDVLFKNQKIYATYKTKFETVNTNIDSIIKRLEALEVLDRNGLDYSEHIKLTETKLNEMDTKTSSIVEDYTKLKDDLLSLKNKIKNLQTNSSEKADLSDDNKTSDIKDNLETLKNNLTNQIGSIKNTIEELDKKITNLESRYNEAERNNFNN